MFSHAATASFIVSIYNLVAHGSITFFIAGLLMSATFFYLSDVNGEDGS